MSVVTVNIDQTSEAGRSQALFLIADSLTLPANRVNPVGVHVRQDG